MANRGSSGASGDVLVLNEDGSVSIGWEGISPATLRRPTAGEWLSFMEEIEAADAWARGEAPEDAPKAGDEPTRKTAVEALKDGRYLRLYQRMLAELADVKVEPSDMPPWLGVGAVAARIGAWWVSSPLHRSEAAAVARTLSQ